jgi:uncharacterized membrane protein HdeD (DUF308 family)
MTNLTTALAVGCIMFGAFLLLVGGVGVYDALQMRRWKKNV